LHVIKKTLESTTQYAKNTVRLPLRQHYKSRWPALNVRRLRETVATDTFFSSDRAMEGHTIAQIFGGKKSYLTTVYSMLSEDGFPDVLQEFIRHWGAPQAVLSDNAKAETSKAVMGILRQYGIEDLQTEPLHPNQNPAERRIQVLKNMTNMILDRTGAPTDLWWLCLVYVVYLLNHLSHEQLDWRTPIEVATGVTPDISSL
jgi:transposase InsO family protein